MFPCLHFFFVLLFPTVPVSCLVSVDLLVLVFTWCSYFLSCWASWYLASSSFPSSVVLLCSSEFILVLCINFGISLFLCFVNVCTSKTVESCSALHLGQPLKEPKNIKTKICPRFQTWVISNIQALKKSLMDISITLLWNKNQCYLSFHFDYQKLRAMIAQLPKQVGNVWSWECCDSLISIYDTKVCWVIPKHK